MSQQKLYQIFTKAPVQTDLTAYGVDRKDGQGRDRGRTLIEANITEGEFHRIFGEDANIVHAMCCESYDERNFTIRIFASDVLACEGSLISHQGQLINALREDKGLEPLPHDQMAQQARSYEDTKPQMMQILLEMAADNPDPHDLETAQAIRDMEEHGFTLDDLIPANAPV